MDCRTAHLLIEAFHDDELQVADAASLLVHLEECPPCAARHQAARRLKEAWRERRPVDRCPAELRNRLAGAFPGDRRRWPAVAGVAAFGVFTAGLGFLAADGIASRGIAFPGSSRIPFAAELPVTRRIEGEVFCLRCALERLFPGASFARTRHLPVLKTDDGRLFNVLDGDLAGRCLSPGCSGRRVSMTARLYLRNGLAEIVGLDAARAGARMGIGAEGPSLAVARHERDR